MKAAALFLALVAGANAADECTIPDVSLYTGIVGDAAGPSLAACSGTTLAPGFSCDIKCDTGYTCNKKKQTITCPRASTTATYSPNTEMATTGCANDYKQSTDALKTPNDLAAAAPAAAATGTCVACAANTYLKATAFANTATACANTKCTLIDVSTLVGIEGDDAEGKQPCSGTTLAAGATCDVKLSAGYAGAGTTQFSCNADASTLTDAELATTGCAAGYLQSSQALRTAVAAKTAAPTAGSEGTCVKCVTDGPAPAAANFANAAPAACPACTLASMGTAGKCVLGCPTDTFQATAKGTDGATATCTACDVTKYKVGATGTALETNAETATSANACGGKGCRLNYYQTAGTPTVTAVTGSDTVGSCSETIQSGAVAGTCLPKEPAYTKRCAAATINTGTAATDKTNCEAVKAYKADGVKKTGTTAADLACNYVAATYVTQVTDCSGGNSKTNCEAIGGGSKCTWTPSANVAAVTTAVDIGCTKCAAGKVAPILDDANKVKAGSYAACTLCDPYETGDCTNGCPADFYQAIGTTAATIVCLPCAAGKTLPASAAGVLTTVQTADACTTPAAAASGAFRSVANAAATAVAASFAAAALM